MGSPLLDLQIPVLLAQGNHAIRVDRAARGAGIHSDAEHHITRSGHAHAVGGALMPFLGGHKRAPQSEQGGRLHRPMTEQCAGPPKASVIGRFGAAGYVGEPIGSPSRASMRGRT